MWQEDSEILAQLEQEAFSESWVVASGPAEIESETGEGASTNQTGPLLDAGGSTSDQALPHKKLVRLPVRVPAISTCQDTNVRLAF